MKVQSLIRKIIGIFKIGLLRLKYRTKINIHHSCLIDIATKIVIDGNCKISINENVFLRSDPRGYHSGMSFPTTLFVDGNNAKIVIGKDCKINGTNIHAQKEIIIGNGCLIASGTHILDSNGHIIRSLSRSQRDNPKSIIIGNNVWIGLNSIILKGTKIGDNSIVGAGSVVQGEFPANVIIKGNPAIITERIY